ncbi:MAG: C39 family peptidase [Ktedonobacteraceae bacterium]|nr:C39 family peptidase [Ktedonobacteraceae bacterium]
MDVMQTGLRSTRLVPTPTQAYRQTDKLNKREIVTSPLQNQAYRQTDKLNKREIITSPLQNYALVSTAQPEMFRKKKDASFISAHLRSLVSLGFLLMVGISLLGASTLSGGGTLQHIIQSISLLSQPQSVNNQNVSLASHTAFPADASQQLVRISQLDPAEYASNAEYNTWAYSACSTASMTEVFNSYGYHYHITDVLSVESQIGAITPELGLVDPSGIASTAAKFGFKTQWGNDGSLDQIINIANSGKPVIVGFPPDRYDGGHILVVIGGDSNNVLLADTSLWNRRVLSRGQFSLWWGGFYAVVTPNK